MHQHNSESRPFVIYSKIIEIEEKKVVFLQFYFNFKLIRKLKKKKNEKKICILKMLINYEEW